MNKQIEDIYPLSPMQQGMLFHSLLAPNSGAYLVQVCFEIHESLDLSRFKQAWQQVVDRHSILRTAFAWEQLDQPLQAVGRQVKLPLEYLDWQALSAAEQQEQQQALRQRQRVTGFLLTKAPLMRVTLIQLQPAVYAVIWSYHHLLLDGWSVPLLLQELLASYSGWTLPPVSPYRRYIAWLQQQDQQQAEQFWRQQLAGFVAPTQLERDSIHQTSEPAESAIYQERQIQLSSSLTAQLRALAQQHQLTLNTLVQAAYALLLSRYSGETDVVFGATYSGRPVNLPQAESMIGLFINTLPMRVKLEAQQFVLPWLRQIQDQQLDLRQYEYSSLTDIQRWSDLPRSSPLFESLLIFENYPVAPKLKQNIAHLKNIQTTEQTNYPISLYVVADATITLRILYDSDRFLAATVAQMLKHLEVILINFIANVNQQICEINLLAESEQIQIAQWNATEIDLGQASIHQQFEAQAERTPDSVALVYEHQQLSYQALNQAANQLSHYLITLGIKPAARVGIYLERSSEMLIALLAVLKAGAIYIPLDPTFPTQRLQFMLHDAEISLLLSHTSLPSPSASLPPRYLTCDLDKLPALSAYPATNPNIAVALDQLAYSLYTSGSTGQPKAVQILHKAVVNLLQSMRVAPGLTPDDTWLAVTTLSFDIAVLELFLPLITGAKLVIMPQSIDPQQLINQIDRHSVSVMQATPAAWQLLLLGGWAGKSDLIALCGGEALDHELAGQLLERVQQLWNLYGPTETTIWSAVQRVEFPASSAIIPIGRPIANTQFYVLDAQLQPVPIGVIGELYIGGMGLAQGYYNRQDLTAARFIPNPFLPGTRLYKTGDRVRHRADGSLAYLGRADYQIKLRGFRIELGEIEAVLMQHPLVQQAIVQVAPTAADRLIAYLKLSPTAEPTASLDAFSLDALLRPFLMAQLPHYMIPASFVPLTAFPLTPNRKIDRQALSELAQRPDQARSDLDIAALPQSAVEQRLAQVWQQVLNLEQVGIHDSFFDLGGHSLLLVKAHSQLRLHYPELSLLDLFRYPTVSSLAGYLSQPVLDVTLDSASSTQTSELLQAGRIRQQQRRQLATRPLAPPANHSYE